MNLGKHLSTLLALSLTANLAQGHTASGQVEKYQLKNNSLKSAGGATFMASYGGLVRVGWGSLKEDVLSKGQRSRVGSSFVIGLLGVFSGFTSVAESFSLEAEGAELTKNKEDIAHRLRQQKSYSLLVQSLGKDRAEEFLSDMISGWTPEKLIEKYARGAEEKKALLSLVEDGKEKSSNTRDSNNTGTNSTQSKVEIH